MRRVWVITILMVWWMTGCTAPVSSERSSYRAVRVVPILEKPKKIVEDVKQFGDYYALLIYVDDYLHLPRLVTPKQDVEELSKVLTQRYGFKEIKIVANPKNSDDLIGELDQFTSTLKEEDNLLLYYAGHGSYSQKTDIGFWQLKNAQKTSRVGWIALNQAINYTISLTPARHVLVLADSCYSGALVRDANIDLDKDLKPTDKQYYSKLYQIKSRNALTSGSLQPVLDNDPQNPNHSVFANGLLSMLTQNTQPIFALEEKFSEIKRYVQLQSREQIPVYKDIRQTGHELGGDFIFLDREVIAKRQTEKGMPEAIKAELDSGKKLLASSKVAYASDLFHDDFVTDSSPTNTKERAKEYQQDSIELSAIKEQFDAKPKPKGLAILSKVEPQIDSTQESIHTYYSSCKKQNATSCRELATLYEKLNETSKATHFFMKACNLGLKEACNTLDDFSSTNSLEHLFQKE